MLTLINPIYPINKTKDFFQKNKKIGKLTLNSCLILSKFIEYIINEYMSNIIFIAKKKKIKRITKKFINYLKFKSKKT